MSYNYQKLFEMFEKITLKERKKENLNNRRGFPTYRGQIYGKVNARYKGIRDLSKDSLDYPEIFAELNKLGKLIEPFKYTSIQVNRNLVAPKHVDGKNVGDSVLVSFGSYGGTSGFIYIDGKKFNAYENPILFNGSQLPHWNSEITHGVKYSLIYFRC